LTLDPDLAHFESKWPMNLAIGSSTLSRIARLVVGGKNRSDCAEFTLPQRNRVFAHFEAGSRRLVGARQLFESGTIVPALVLYHQGALLLMKAGLAARDVSTDVARMDAVDAQMRFVESLDQSQKKDAARLCEILGTLQSIDGMAADRLPQAEAAELVEELAGLTERLRESVEPKSLREVSTARHARWAMLVSLLALAAVWGVVRTLRPSNIALHKQATASGTAALTSPAAAVDGKAYGNNGFQSEGPSPWLTIDLGRRYALTEADIYGRHDCCFDQSVPLSFDVSDDGKTFRTVATREAPFEMLEAWNIKFGSTTVARYVRLHTLKDSVLYLNEVELNGWAVD
jgi:hypothetical protein